MYNKMYRTKIIQKSLFIIKKTLLLNKNILRSFNQCILLFFNYLKCCNKTFEDTEFHEGEDKLFEVGSI